MQGYCYSYTARGELDETLESIWESGDEDEAIVKTEDACR